MNAPHSDWPVVFFPEPLVTVIVIGALALTGIGAATLLWLLAKDRRNRQIW
ncbi:MAG: hypothetical protein KDM81_09700 [Verrucomicrobiae bacterium]|nr:hypothetical protein [Verrucomicrobiae bacterium]MCP5518046.1 hypothetical protein [Verrucomicrobiales bacterium]